MSMPTGRRRSERSGLDPSGLAPRLAKSGRRCGPGTGMGNDRYRYRQSDAVEAEAALPRMRQAFGARALSVLLEALQGRRPKPLAVGTLRDSRAGRGRRSRRRPAGIEAHPPGSGRIRERNGVEPTGRSCTFRELPARRSFLHPPLRPSPGHRARPPRILRAGVHSNAGQAGFSCYNPRASGELRLP